jgi:2-polyprenyl-6-methoxyphenol hydroxylase-like FAD-dependent oxidoreductase
MFYILPQAHGRARLYLNCSPQFAARCKGANRAERFLEAFFLDCIPYSDLLRKARPAGPCMIAPSYSTTVEEPYLDGVVLIGDEAGYNDPILGTGLSNGFRDARIVGDILLTSSDWTVDAFRPYGAERRERLRKLNFSADVLGLLNAEFGPDAMGRRKRAWQRMRENPNYMAVFVVGLAGPDVVPDFAFTDYLVERLVAPEGRSAPRQQSRLVAGLTGGGNGRPSAGVPAQRS